MIKVFIKENPIKEPTKREHKVWLKIGYKVRAAHILKSKSDELAQFIKLLVLFMELHERAEDDSLSPRERVDLTQYGITALHSAMEINKYELGIDFKHDNRLGSK